MILSMDACAAQVFSGTAIAATQSILPHAEAWKTVSG